MAGVTWAWIRSLQLAEFQMMCFINTKRMELDFWQCGICAQTRRNTSEVGGLGLGVPYGKGP